MKWKRIARGLLFVAVPALYIEAIVVTPLHTLVTIFGIALGIVCVVGLFLMGYTKCP